MIYYLKRNLAKEEGSTKTIVEPIMFLSQLLYPAETCYLLTKLELANIVKVVQKIRYMIELSKY